MSYPTFPTICPPAYPADDIYPDNKIASPTDGGYTISRPRYTRTQMGGAYTWPAMPYADYLQFKAFVQANYAHIFVWTDPITGRQTNMQFTAVPKASMVSPGYWHVEIAIMEA